VTQATGALERATADRDNKKAAIRPRLLQFRAAVSGLLAGTVHARGLPQTPDLTTVETRFLTPFVDMAQHWAAINADITLPGFSPPLLLAGNYARDNFTAEIAALRAAFTAYAAARKIAQDARAGRDVLLDPVRERMRQYRQVVKARLLPGHALLLTVPRLTPAPGTTPAAVVLTARWDAALNKAVYTWQPSTDANLRGYSLRAVIGDRYSRDEEQSITSLLAPNTNTFHSDYGLTATGSVVHVKVYVLTTTGNEKGSEPITVVRPE